MWPTVAMERGARIPITRTGVPGENAHQGSAWFRLKTKTKTQKPGLASLLLPKELLLALSFFWGAPEPRAPPWVMQRSGSALTRLL